MDFSWLKHILEVSKEKPVLWALCGASGALLFVDGSFYQRVKVPEPDGILRIALFLIFVLSAFVILAQLLLWLASTVGGWFRNRQGKAELKSVIRKLSIQEKSLLKTFVHRNCKTISLRADDDAASGLRELSILYLGQVGHPISWPHTMPPDVWDVLVECPELLEGVPLYEIV